MRILVCVKQVPRLDQVRFTPGLNRIVRDGVESTINPLDLLALGHALALRARHGGEVAVATMGPPGARAVLERALRSGADRAVHLVDPCFAGADTLATARALCRLVRRESPDLVLFGRSTVDGGTGQVGPQVAEFAGLPQVTGAVELAVAGGSVTVVRETEQAVERWRVPLPAVVSVERGPQPGEPDLAGPVRPAGPVRELDAGCLGGDSAGYGIRGSATYVQRVLDRAVARAGERLTDPRAGAARIAALAERATRPAAGVPEPACRPAGSPELWVVAERYRDGLHPVSLEGLAVAGSVADRLAATVTGVLLSGDPPGPAERMAAELAAHGADRVLLACHPEAAGAPPEWCAAVLAGLVGRGSPLAVIGPWTAHGRDYLPRVAARLGVGMTGDVVGLDTDPNPGDGSVLDLVWLKPAWAGGALARVVARTVPSMGTLRPGSVPVPARRRMPAEVVTDVVEIAPPAGATPVTATLLAADPGGAGLAEAGRVLICLGGGAGAQVAELARGLAARPGWELVGTPAAAGRGLVPPAREMAVARRSLSPALVVALDVGELAELDALRGAGTVVTVGRVAPGSGDPIDPAGLPGLAGLADLALVADTASVLRALAELGGAG
ncbi:MAG TPA: electron transfer flavoprotein [Mycobacteriales bacterium]|nr:electron transfer flavoprotein [Mycobacteriales bacterium]